MNFVIVGIYDSWYYFSININGKLYERGTKIVKDAYKAYWHNDNENQTFDDYLLETYKDYDLIVVCEDGFIEILKGGKK